tara:strand:+ start:159 stop:1613 length:1455 start_codon:yes stop_codon:yes gene_type:complete
MNSYKKIIKTTGVIGVVQVFKLFFGFLQNKVLAIIVGPSGIGIWGLYNSLVQLVSSFSTLGIDQAGVKQIAQNEGDEKKISDTIWVFKNSILLLSTISVLLIITFSNNISVLLFGDKSYQIGIIIVSFAVLFNSFNQGQISILNGFSEIKKIARSQIYGAIGGGLFAILFVVLYKEKGIPFFILGLSFISAFFSWKYVKKKRISSIRPSFSVIKKEFSILFSIGIGIAYSAIIVAIMTYLMQVYIRKEFGLNVLGIYNASFTISNIYIGVILSAMGVDLMPRLSKIIENKKLVNKMVNDQMELGLLISSIGIVCILLFSPIILNILYSNEFSEGKNIIRWQILGVFLRVLAFPLGYILIIKKKTLQFVIVQTVMWCGNYFFLIVLTNLWGVDVLGLNYFISYIIYVLVLFIFTKREMVVSHKLKRVFIFSSFFIICSWLITNYLSFYYMVFLGGILIFVNLYWVISYLKNEMDINVISILKLKK